MLSNAQNKYIRSLTQQKYRKQYKVFIVEGDKIAGEWLSANGAVQMIVATQDWLVANLGLLQRHPEAEVCEVTQQELEKVSSLKTPNKVLLVVLQQKQEANIPADGWCIAVEKLQDPGNMGTIIRIADWFGIKHVICSPDSVDYYNPKVVQAAMGGHLRIGLHVADLEDWISKAEVPVFAAVLGGEDVFTVHTESKGILLIGNESKGLSEKLLAAATHKVTIPGKGGAESLNAGVSAGILAAVLTRS